ncbi:fatty acid desaturase [Noviherbaspirillum aridicola]|uniref:Beta-carotene ketolase n=1 Tax=Noviherbaspirillum aridicola TaxID=2849687 RepID=A0ABQ4Q6H6_9BURK|nr:fatty acid desaturase [Noviherbaspirillum aridicola]GIZ52723.1 beta-carotene ketolase [Noviherbaspirillum aridicola]
MRRSLQDATGATLAVLIAGAWLALHVAGVFFLDAGRPATALLVVLQTWLSVGLYIVAHDAMHGSLLRSRKAGERVGALAVWLYAGFGWRRLVTMHRSHHLYAGTPQDPDFAPDTPSALLPWYLRFMRTYFGARECAVMALRVGAYVLLGARIENILLFFAVPGLLSSFQLFYFGTYLPHRHETDAAFPDRHRARSSRYDYLASLLSCFHFGYHHEHHRRPDVPWWRLPALRRGD